MKQEQILFWTADDYPVYKGHEMWLWIKSDGEVYPAHWTNDSDVKLNPTKNTFFSKQEAEKFDITNCEIGTKLYWRIESHIGDNNPIDLVPDTQAIYLGLVDDLHLVIDVNSKNNIKMDRANARQLLKESI